MKEFFKSIIKNSLILSLLAMILFNLTPIFAQTSTQNVNRNHLCNKKKCSGKVADGEIVAGGSYTPSGVTAGNNCSTSGCDKNQDHRIRYSTPPTLKGIHTITASCDNGCSIADGTLMIYDYGEWCPEVKTPKGKEAQNLHIGVLIENDEIMCTLFQINSLSYHQIEHVFAPADEKVSKFVTTNYNSLNKELIKESILNYGRSMGLKFSSAIASLFTTNIFISTKKTFEVTCGKFKDRYHKRIIYQSKTNHNTAYMIFNFNTNEHIFKKDKEYDVWGDSIINSDHYSILEL